MAKRNIVSTKVDKDYFEKFFEPERRRINAKLNLNLSQTKFTAFIHQSGAKLTFPKQRRAVMNRNSRKRIGGLF